LTSADDVVKIVADRYAAAGEMVRAGIDQADEQGDAGTTDLLTGISRMLDQSLYFIESNLQK
jgi:starvation-inducible DNA-binding protein